MSEESAARGEDARQSAGRDGDGRPVVVLVTGPDSDALARLGRRLVEERLAACMNVAGEVTSIYRWEGDVREESESLALLKTTSGRIDALEARIRELHSYDEPEVVVLPVTGGSASYLDWVRASVSSA